MADGDAEKARKSNYNPYDKSPLILSKGLFTDTNEEFQPDGTYRFALNASLITNAGEKGALANEEGNSRCIDLGDDEVRIIGNCLLNDGRVVLFVYHSIHGPYPAHSAILIQNEDCTAEYLIRSECLGFLPTDVINCEYKIQNGCDVILYFTDKRTKYKSININKLSSYVLQSRTLDNANTPISGSFGWDCGLFNFNPDYNIPQIELEQIEFGGKLRVGTYFIGIRYLDGSLNGNNWSPLSNPIYITFPSGTVDPMEISGGLLNVDSLIDGSYLTSKSIKLKITDLDTRYQYFQLLILECTQGTATNNLTHVSTPYNISDTETTVLISEISANNGFIATSSAVIIPNEYLDVVRAHTQVDRRLIVGNLSNNVNDWSVFQRAANNIKSIYYTYEKVANLNRDNCQTEIINQIQIDGVKGAEFNRAEFLFDQKTYMRDEIYAFGIMYVFNDGKLSPVFHIPGRPAISNVAGTDINGNYSVTNLVTPFETFNVAVGRERWYFDYNDIWAGTGATNAYYDNYNAPFDGSWDRTIYTSVSNSPKPHIDFDNYDGFNSGLMGNVSIDDSQNILSNSFCESDTEGQRWEIVNTSIKFNTQKPESTVPFEQLQLLTADTLYSAGICAYYETDTQYPNILGCDGLPIFPYSIVDGNVIMHKIRHHRMPDARKERFFEGLGTDNANTLMSLKPLGMFFYDIAIPIGYEDKIQGYYIVRGDRAGNKTVIDKGWLNVCDTTIGIRNSAIVPPNNFLTGVPTYKFDKTIQQNPAFMIPTDKFGSNELGNAFNASLFYKRMHVTGSNYVEYFSPKSSFNEPVNLQSSYYKLENTIITTKIKEVEIKHTTGIGFQDQDWSSSNTVCDEPEAWESLNSFRIWGYIETYDLKLPRMFAYSKQGDFHLLHNVPILYNEYTLYNQNNIAANTHTLNNDNHRQTIMLSKLYEDQYGLPITNVTNDPLKSIYKPLAYFRGTELGYSGIPDMLNPANGVDSPTSDATLTLGRLAENNDGPTKELNSFREEEVGHFYYAALKLKIKPYSKLQNISYVKASNQIQFLPNPPSLGSTFNKGGDCFISKQRLFKSFQRTTKEEAITNGANDGKLAGTVIVGYVESEINAHFRHKFNSDLNYYFRPVDSWQDSLKTAVQEVHLAETTLVDFIEHLYRYNLDYSVDNTIVKYSGLPDIFDYCSECSERFPHTIRYSEPSLSTQTSDNYKIFLSNSIQEIPTETGEITNLFVKEQNLFIHTVSNLYRLNLAPQSLQTTNDQIQVGSGTLANAIPQRLFDNANGYGRGGIEFERSGVFCNDIYIWVDSKSKRVYGLSKGLDELSMLGMNMWFRNNLNLTLRDQWKSIAGRDYPYLNTSDRKCIGFIATFDPYFDRYILHKKDYELSTLLLNNLEQDLGTPYTVGNYYWNDLGLFRATTISSLKEVNFEDDELIKNKSFTISLSIQDKAWASFHSYRPNHIWSNNLTFFSTVNNVFKADYIWKHNVHNYQTYYDVKHDFIYDYVAKGSEPIVTKAFDNIEIIGNVYNYDSLTEQWREVFYSCFNKLHVYNNTQSSGMFDLFVKNPSAYYDVYNDFVNSRTLSVKRNRDIWRINNLRDYSENILGGNTTINSTNWLNPDYSSYFTTNENMGYIDYVSNANYINESKNTYELQRFRDKFLNVRLFYKPNEDYKIVINTMANLKRALL